MGRGGSSPNRNKADYGRGQHRINASEFVYTPEGMVALLRSRLVSPTYKPPLLPAIAVELLTLTRQQGVSVGEVRQMLERDPLLAAKVLQQSQAALYARGTPIRSLDDAISRLGLLALGDLFLATVLSTRVFRAKGYEDSMTRLLRHSTLTAHIARSACRLTALPDEYAFLCGLLHDVGAAAGILILAEPLALHNAEHPLPPPSLEELTASVQQIHEEASGVLAQSWRLNPDVRLVLENHHHFRIGGRVHPLAAVVCVADWMAAKAGATFGSESNEAEARAAAESLGLTRANLDGLRGQAEEVLALL
jgi:HD-like signal output (HDOD) protein